MKKTNKIMEFVNKAAQYTDKNSPTILTAMGVVGLITTGVLAFKAGSKAKDVIEEHKKDLKLVKRNDKEAKREVIKETIKDVAPIIAPPVLLGAATGACIIGANTISSKRIAMLTTAYTFTEKSLKEWKAKTEEVVGSKKVEDIKTAIAKEDLKNPSPMFSGEKIINTGKGDIVCRDLYTGKCFYTSTQALDSAILAISSDVVTDMWASIDDFYAELGVTECEINKNFGWNPEDLVRNKIPVSYKPLLTDDHQIYIALEYDVFLRQDYRDLM